MSKYQNVSFFFCASAILVVMFFDCQVDVIFCCAFTGGGIITLPQITTITNAAKEIVIASGMMPTDLSDNSISIILSNQEKGNIIIMKIYGFCTSSFALVYLC